jgi:outer membrane receptor protein involved in Fe transport
MRALLYSTGVALIATTAPAHAGEASVDVPAGRAGTVAIALARQTGTSIVIADRAIAERPAPRIKGRMAPDQAVRRLAEAIGGRAVMAGPGGWRIVAPPPKPAVRMAKAARAAAPVVQAQPEAVDEPIVVVGSKRDLKLEQYPGQATMLDGRALEIGGVGGTEKITQRIATVTSTHLGSGRNKLFIRGIADSSFTGSTQATVGQYLGDLRLSYNSPDPDLRLSDIERVEVLEGPQGALYGAGSLGGILRIVPRMPVQGLTSGSAQIGGSLTQSGDPGGDASATLNLPVAGEAVALRVTANATSEGGYIDKPFLAKDDVNRTHILAGRAILRVEPTPDLTLDIIAFGQSTRARDSQYADRNGPPLTSLARIGEGARADYGQVQAVVSARIDEVQLKSTTGITGQTLEERYDATVPAGPPRLFEQTNDTRMVAHETRIWQTTDGGFGWLAGASFTHNVARIARSFIEDGKATQATGVRNRVDELTFYGEASLPLLPGLTATGGGRYTHSRLGGEGEEVTRLVAAALAGVTAKRTEARFLPSASLLATLRPNAQLYLRYQQGFRPGGLAIENDFVRRFRNDRTATYEFGGRYGRPGTGPFDLSVSLSYTRWNDIQADFIDGAGLPSSANIGDGRVWSASISGSVRLVSGLRLDAGVTVNRSRVDKPDTTVLLPLFATVPAAQRVVELFGRTTQVPNIAGFSGRMGIAWNHDLGRDLMLDARAWASYIGRSRLGIGPELGEPQGDYFDSGLTLRVGRENAGVTLSVTNIANARGNRFSLGTPFSVGREQVTPLRPRTLRLGFDASF